MKRFRVLVVLIVVLASFTYGQSQRSSEKCRDESEILTTLANQYKELRAKRRIRRDGQFNYDLDHSNGKLHEVMYKLGLELGRPAYSQRNVISYLGEPDAIYDDKQMNRFLEIYKRELGKSGREMAETHDREYLVYYWRGGHDFLFFITRDGVVEDHGWWFAYE